MTPHEEGIGHARYSPDPALNYVLVFLVQVRRKIAAIGKLTDDVKVDQKDIAQTVISFWQDGYLDNHIRSRIDDPRAPASISADMRPRSHDHAQAI
jgi:hypothetical protein